MIPSSSVGNQQVSISLKIGNVDASDLLVVDPTALDNIKNDLDAEVTKQVSVVITCNAGPTDPGLTI